MSESPPGSPAQEYVPSSPAYEPSSPEYEPASPEYSPDPVTHNEGLFRVTFEGRFSGALVPHARSGSADWSSTKLSRVVQGGTGVDVVIVTLRTNLNDPPTLSAFRRNVEEMENYMQTEVFHAASGPFEVKSSVPDTGKYADYWQIMWARSSEREREWVSAGTGDNIYDWFRSVVPKFPLAFMSDSRMRRLRPYSIKHASFLSIDSPLVSNQENILVVFPLDNDRTFVTTRGDLDTLGGGLDELRVFACTDATPVPHYYSIEDTARLWEERTVSEVPLLDLNKMNTLSDGLIREDSLQSFEMIGVTLGRRVACLFPSFDEFPGLVNATTKECVVDPSGPYRVYGVGICPGEGLSGRQKETCYPNEASFRIRLDGGCGEGSSPSPSPSLSFTPDPGDPSCCGRDSERTATILNIYGSRDRSVQQGPVGAGPRHGFRGGTL